MDPDRSVAVSCELRFRVTSPHTCLALQIAPAPGAGWVEGEWLSVEPGPGRVDSPTVEEVQAPSGRVTVVQAEPGDLAISYGARVHRARRRGGAATPTGAPSGSAGAASVDRIVGLRPSRFCPSDRLAGFAAREFGALADRDDLAGVIADWVFEHVAYDPDASHPSGSAIDTLLSQAGVCRDFAHLTVALCRAMGIPARLAAVYAPGLSPMDFHAVAEVLVQGRWLALDASRMAPRPSMVRISTGRDAADTAFASTLWGYAELVQISVGAVVHPELPEDDHHHHVNLG